MEKKILVIYATLTGNTQMAAMQLADSLNLETMSVDELPLREYKNYDLLVFGVSTWGEGDFNPATEDFINKIKSEKQKFEGVNFALFGLGDSSYTNFCGAVDKVAGELKSVGGKIIGDIHKIDGFVDEEKAANLLNWANGILSGKLF